MLHLYSGPPLGILGRPEGPPGGQETSCPNSFSRAHSKKYGGLFMVRLIFHTPL